MIELDVIVEIDVTTEVVVDEVVSGTILGDVEMLGSAVVGAVVLAAGGLCPSAEGGWLGALPPSLADGVAEGSTPAAGEVVLALPLPPPRLGQRSRPLLITTKGGMSVNSLVENRFPG